MAKTTKDRSGRQSKTRGVSLSETEAQLVDRFAELSGIGFTEQVRKNLMIRLPAAVALLEDMRASGMELDPGVVQDQVVYVQTEDERRKLREDTFVSAEVQHTAGAHA
jgi:hypothetical protein